jgi:hypothetical protein
MFKFELSDTIYYLRDNKVHSAPILSRMWVDNAHPEWDATFALRGMYQSFGTSREVYVTCHGVVRAEEAHISAQSLAYSFIEGL